MRHKKAKSLLNRFTSWRRATLISLAKNILIYQSIKTTLQKAKAARPMVDRLISLAKKNTLFARRQAYKILGSHKLVSLLFGEIGPRFNNRDSGFTRILNLGKRRGDSADLVVWELTEIKKKAGYKHKKEKEEIQPKEELPGTIQEKTIEEKQPKTEVAVKEKPPITKKPTKKFLGGLRGIFTKERDSF